MLLPSATLTEKSLKDRDYTVILARGAANFGPPAPGVKQGWQKAQDLAKSLAEHCADLAADGLNVYLATQPCVHYSRISPSEVSALLPQESPMTCNVTTALQEALDAYFARKAAGQAKPNGEIIIVLLDAEPRDRMTTVKLIMAATQQIEQDSELGIAFVQIGENMLARGFLTSLDDDLRAAGARFDIVNATDIDDIDEAELTDFLLDALRD